MSTHAATTHTLTKQDLTDRPVPPPLKGLGAQFMMALRDNTLRNPWFIGGSIGRPPLRGARALRVRAPRTFGQPLWPV